MTIIITLIKIINNKNNHGAGRLIIIIFTPRTIHNKFQINFTIDDRFRHKPDNKFSRVKWIADLTTRYLFLYINTNCLL